MKQLLFVFILSAGSFISGNLYGQATGYGAKIDEKGAIPISEMQAVMDDSEEMNMKVEGEVSEVCQVKGCWMTLKKPDGTSMRVTFKDYAFFVPKDLSGKTVVVSGRAYKKTTSVEQQRHYAEDAKKSKEEIEKITTPKEELAFEAEGVIVK